MINYYHIKSLYWSLGAGARALGNANRGANEKVDPRVIDTLLKLVCLRDWMVVVRSSQALSLLGASTKEVCKIDYL